MKEDLIRPYQLLIRRCSLFAGIQEADFEKALEYLNADVRNYEKGDILLRLDSPFRYAGIVLEGTVEGSFINENFNKININVFRSGWTFGEAMACIRIKRSPIQLTALTDCRRINRHFRSSPDRNHNSIRTAFLPQSLW